MPHLDIMPGDLVQVRGGRNAGKVGVVVTSLYKTHGGKWFSRDPSLTYCLKDPGSNATIYTTGSNLTHVKDADEDITIYAW